MTASITQHDLQTWIIALSGKLNFQSSKTFQQIFNQAEQTSARLIILDLAELTYIDCTGLGLVALAHRNLTPNGISLAIANAQSHVEDIIRLTNLDKMYPLYDSVEAASQRSTITFLPHK